jgi:hypothetical protein
MRLLSRLILALTVVLGSLALPLSALPSAAQEATPAATPAGTAPPFMGETYVGETSDPDTFVAVVVAEAEDGEERQTRAYLCNATTIDVWLMGTLTEDRLDLQSEDGARLEAALGEAGVEGTATLADGTSLTFTTQPATGIAGLYTVTIGDDGQLAGISATGGQLDGQVETGAGTPEAAGASPTAGLRLVMRMTSPDGGTAELEAQATVADEGSFRLIVLEDGRGRGRGKTKDGSGFIDPTMDD